MAILAGLLLPRLRPLRSLPPLLWIVALPMAASNTGVLPSGAPSYDFIIQYVLAFALCLLLLRVNLRTIVRDSGWMLVAYSVAAISMMIGFWVAHMLVFERLLDNARSLTASLSASFTGGTINLLAVGQITGIEDPAQYSVLIGATIVVASMYLVVMSVICQTRWFKAGAARAKDAEIENSVTETDLVSTRKLARTSVFSLVFVVAVALTVSTASFLLTSLLDVRPYVLLFITMFSILAGTALRGLIDRARGDDLLGLGLVYLVMAVFGASTDIVRVVGEGVLIIGLLACACAIQMIITFPLGKLFRVTGPELVTASIACVMGSGNAAAFAASQRWQNLITPGVLCGTLGLVVGTFLGLFMFWLIS